MSIDPRQTGTFNFNANFEVGIQGPMDARQLCPTFDDRATLEYTYQGMLCVVTRDEERAGGSAANNGVYVRINDPVSTGRTPEDPTVDADWELRVMQEEKNGVQDLSILMKTDMLPRLLPLFYLCWVQIKRLNLDRKFFSLNKKRKMQTVYGKLSLQLVNELLLLLEVVFLKNVGVMIVLRS